MINLTGGKEYRWPYPLIYFRRVWSNYEGILSRLPPADLYVQNQDGKHLGPGRASFSLVERNIDRLPGTQRLFWGCARDALHDPHLRDYVASRLGVTETGLHPFATLCRDTAGHFIDVHPDWDRKVITVQFYLPADEKQRALGTDIYDHDKRWVRQLPFMPNTAYAFARSDVSYHGLKVLPDTIRNTLMLTYYREPFDEY